MKFTQFIKEFRSAHPDLNMSFKECMQSDDIKGAYKDIIGAGLAKKPAKIAEPKKVQEILGKEAAVGEWKKPPEERGIKGGTKAKRGKDCPPCPPCDRRRCVGDKGKRGGKQQKEYKLKGKENIQIIINNAAPSEGESKPPVTPGVLPMKQIKPEPGPGPQSPPAGPPATPRDFGQAEAKEDDDDDDDFPPPPDEYPDVDPKHSTYVSPDSTFPTFYSNAPISPDSYNVPSGLLLPDQYGFYADHRGFYPHTIVGLDPNTYTDDSTFARYRFPSLPHLPFTPVANLNFPQLPALPTDQTQTGDVPIRRPKQTPRRPNYTNKGGVGQQVLVKREKKPVVQQTDQTTTDLPVDQPYVQDDDDIPGVPTTVHEHPGVETTIPPPAPYPPYGQYPVYHMPPPQPFSHAAPYVAPTPYVPYVASTPYIPQMPLVPPSEVPSEPMDVEEQVDATKTIESKKVSRADRPPVKPPRKQVSTRAKKLDTRTDVTDMPRKVVTEIPDVPAIAKPERKKRSEDKIERQVFKPEELPPRTARKELPTMKVQDVLMPMRRQTDASPSTELLNEPSPELPVEVPPQQVPQRKPKEKLPFRELPFVEPTPKRKAITKRTEEQPYAAPAPRSRTAAPIAESKTIGKRGRAIDEEQPAPVPAPRSRTVADVPVQRQGATPEQYRQAAQNIVDINYMLAPPDTNVSGPTWVAAANREANEEAMRLLTQQEGPIYNLRALGDAVRRALRASGREKVEVKSGSSTGFYVGRGLRS